ncbi:hypothetical protein DFH27DRAFT_88483 [Peziza echinospora]|nr:hypothetical protein DFH27DRAFT_88483 [Peziza echinospora]
MLAVAFSYVAPIFIITSPLTSYADQIRSIHKNKSSRGFSLDTPLIMLVASILRCFYWLGSTFETSLLIQSLIMIVVQLLLLKVALDHRPSDNAASAPFHHASVSAIERPYNFWQWRSQKPYWDFLIYFFLTFSCLQLLVGSNQTYINIQGYLALGIEAILPIPQAIQNYKSKSCHGFRLSVLGSWIIGDVMKQIFFYTAEHISIQFKVCALFQMCVDLFLGFQFFMYGNGEAEKGVLKPIPLSEKLELEGTVNSQTIVR